MLLKSITPMPLQRRTAPFDHPDWLFELKYDGFRALACVNDGQCTFVSRNGNRFGSWPDLQEDIARGLKVGSAVLDGEIVCLDERGHPQFNDLLFRRGAPVFFGFDMLFNGNIDMRFDWLCDRKEVLKRAIHSSSCSRLLYADHVEATSIELFDRVCQLDLEGIVAKHKYGPYVDQVERSTWYKIRNREYSQWAGRDQLFERDRHREPVAGWHACELACDESTALEATV